MSISVGDRVRCKRRSDKTELAPEFQGLTGTIKRICDTKSIFKYVILWDSPSIPGRGGGPWSEFTLEYIGQANDCAECGSTIFDRGDYLCYACRNMAR